MISVPSRSRLPRLRRTSSPQLQAHADLRTCAKAGVIAALGYGTGQALASVLGTIDADEIWTLGVVLVAGALIGLIAHFRATRRRRLGEAPLGSD